ncbi:MAG: L-fuconate dehydratase, partial [Frankiales bacterium]|nr:L-fuconate dehydratase [Frankiales bacterium]
GQVTERITHFDVTDVRFPTSRWLAGSDAMNPDPDYSVAYLVVHTDGGQEGHGFAFTIGRGTEVEVAGIRAVEPLVVGLDVDEVLGDLGGFSRRLVGDSPLRWLGPEKGVIHMAIGAVVNAMWDMLATRENKPLWKLLADMTPQQLVDLVDFRYLTDALTPAEALDLLVRGRAGAADRERTLLADGYPAYTTSAGWLGYSDEKVAMLCKEAVEEGFDHLKLKVGGDIEDDVRRCQLVRGLVGEDVRLSIDANQRWDIDEAIANVARLAPSSLWWVEEPTSPDDVLGHARIAKAIAPIRVAAGEHVANRVMFKQLLASGGIDVCQIDACRVGGVNENVAILLLAAKFGVSVCPHAGGVGLCEVVRHLAMFDYVAVSGSTTDRWIEYVDHLHEHFSDPVRIVRGRYIAPQQPGSSARMLPGSIEDYRYPDGRMWQEGHSTS